MKTFFVFKCMQCRREIAPLGFEAKVLQVWELEDKLAKLKETDA